MGVEFIKTRRKAPLIVFMHFYQSPFVFFLLIEHQDNSVNEKDFILVNATYGYIIAVECKRNLDKETLEKSLQQLNDTKKDLETYFRNGILEDEPELSPDWIFMPMIYCEKVTNDFNYCKSCEKNIIKGNI